MGKKVTGWVLAFLGVFLLVGAILFATVGKSDSRRTPLNVNSNTFLTGTADKYNTATGTTDEDLPVKVLSNTKVDPKRSDGKVVVFVSYNCVNVDRDNPPDCLKGDDDRLVVNSDSVFAANRKTGMAVNDAKYTGPDAEKYVGLVNKFPFDTQKKTYPYFDGLLGKAVDAKYDSTTKIDGLKVYKFTIDVPSQTAKVAGDVVGNYETQKEIYVEPVTGSIVNQVQHELRTLDDGTVILDMSLKFTPKTVKSSVDDGKANVSKLGLIATVLPLVCLIIGLLALIIGVLVLRRAGRTTEEA